MAKNCILILSIVIIYFKVCWSIEAVDDDLLVIPRSQTVPEDSEEINEASTKGSILSDDQNIIKNKFRIRLTFKPYDFKSRNHSTLKLNYTFNTIHQFLELGHFNLQQNSSESSRNSSMVPTLVAPCLNVSTTFHKNCFRLEQKRIQLSERQVILTQWRKNLKVLSSKLNRRKSVIDRKEKEMSESKKKFDEDVLWFHNSKIELQKTQYQLEKDKKKIRAEKFQLRNREAKLKAYEQELKDNMTNLLDFLAPVSNETAEIQASYSNLNSSMDQKNASYCNLKTEKLGNDDRHLKLCQWSERLNTKIRELVKEQAEFEEYKMTMINDGLHQLSKVEVKFQEDKQEPPNQEDQVHDDN